MYYPTLDEARILANQGNLMPGYREINADLETPVSAYLKVARGRNSFLLESVEGGERFARYSFIGTEPSRVLKTGPGEPGGLVDPLAVLQREMASFNPVAVRGLPRFHGGAVGYLAYDAARYFERLPTPEHDVLKVPESVFMLTDSLLVFDHVRHRIQVVSMAHVDGDVETAYAKAVRRIDHLVERLRQPLEYLPAGAGGNGASEGAPVSSNSTRGSHHDIVRQAKEYIEAGEIIQTVLSQRLSRPTSAHPFNLYRALRAVNPSPYMYFLHLDDFHIIGASPEMLVRVDEGQIDYHPIAGTRPRGASEEEDLALAEELQGDEKERAEHIMLVDLGRNDVGRVSQPGTVRVTQLMEMERYSHVMHLVSHIVGKLRPGMTSFDALRSCFPAGTVSGAPKIRAMEIIAELEPDRRGPYAGAVGYFDFSGNMDTAIAIRTMVFKDGVAHIQAGGGIVADSVEETEYQETLHKAAALMRAIDHAEQMEREDYTAVHAGERDY